MSNYKPFDLEKAKAGNPVVTRDGRKVRILCTDLKHNIPIIAAIDEGDGTESVLPYTKNGEYCFYDESEHDLFMAPVKKTYYVNIYKYIKPYDENDMTSVIYDDIEGAKITANDTDTLKFVKTISFELE